MKVSLGSLHPAAFLAVTVNWYTSQGEPSSVPLKLKLGMISSPDMKTPLVFRLVTLTKQLMATLGKANGVNGGVQERVDVSTGSRVRSVGGSGLSEKKK